MLSPLAVLAMLVAFLFVRSRILDRVTDPVTRRNQKRLGQYLLALVALFWLLLIWIGRSSRT